MFVRCEIKERNSVNNWTKDKRTLHCPTNGDPCPQANEKTMVTGGDPCIGPHPHHNGCHKKWCGIVLYRTPFQVCVYKR